MKVIEKMRLVEDIARRLQEDCDNLADVEAYLSHFEVDKYEPNEDYFSIISYVKTCLKKINENEIIKIADDLSMPSIGVPRLLPKNWEGTNEAKVFISHRSEDKALAIRLRDTLKVYNINAFVAHVDIKPSKEWQEEIKNALNTMDFFIAIINADFEKRYWCQQEVGYAVARRIFIVPIKFSKENPPGFLAKLQAVNRGNKRAEEISKEIIDILKTETATDVYNEKIKAFYEKRIPSDLDDDIPF